MKIVDGDTTVRGPAWLSLPAGIVCVGAGLNVEQFLVDPARGDEFIVGAVFGDPAVVEHDDPVGLADIGQPMRDQDRGPGRAGGIVVASGGVVQSVEHPGLGLGVQRGGGFVGDEDHGIA